MEKVNYTAKEKDLREQIQKYGEMIVALSGGVDSSLLTIVAHEELGDGVTAVTIDSPFLARRDLHDAVDLTTHYKIRH